MNNRIWSFLLSWGRLGVNAALFLVATRFLTLSEIGLFATAFAPIRMTQSLHKAGITDAVVVLGKTQRRRDALYALSVTSGLALALLFGVIGWAFSPLLFALACIPLLNGLSAVSDGLLRQSLAVRALALRTLVAQGAAAALALWLLVSGWGPWALVGFAISNAALTCALTLSLARWWPTRLPTLRYLSLILPKTGQFAARVLLGAAQLPLAQLLIGLTLGPAAAGAFQIATRMLELIDALTLSPLRFIALPQLSRQSGPAFHTALAQQLRIAASLSVWVWAGTLVAAPAILTIAVGADHAPSAAPVLRALAGQGLIGALLMPLIQALLARGHTRLVILRAIMALGVGTLVILPALAVSATSVALALSLATVLTALWLLPRALATLEIPLRDLAPVLAPVFAGTAMVSALALIPLPLFAQVALGTALYATLIALLRRPHWRMA